MTTEQTSGAAPAANTPSPNVYDAMAAVFDELVEPAPAAPAAAADPKTEIDAAAATSAATPEPAQAAAGAAVGTETTPPATGSEAAAAASTSEGKAAGSPPAAAAEPAAPAASAGSPVDWEARFKALQTELEALKKPASEPTPEPAKPATPAAPAEIYSADEKEFLSTYEKEWPDVTRGEALKRRAEYGQIVSHVFGEIARVYGPMLDHAVRGADTASESATLDYIRVAHADYDDAMYDAVVGWAEGLTGYRKKLAQAIIEEGEPADVVGLLTEFKEATGRTKAPAAGTTPSAAAPAPAAPAAAPQLSAAAKQAAKAMGVVEGKRTAAAVPGLADPNDFDGAWSEAVAAA